MMSWAWNRNNRAVMPNPSSSIVMARVGWSAEFHSSRGADSSWQRGALLRIPRFQTPCLSLLPNKEESTTTDDDIISISTSLTAQVSPISLAASIPNSVTTNDASLFNLTWSHPDAKDFGCSGCPALSPLLLSPSTWLLLSSSSALLDTAKTLNLYQDVSSSRNVSNPQDAQLDENPDACIVDSACKAKDTESELNGEREALSALFLSDQPSTTTSTCAEAFSWNQQQHAQLLAHLKETLQQERSRIQAKLRRLRKGSQKVAIATAASSARRSRPWSSLPLKEQLLVETQRVRSRLAAARKRRQQVQPPLRTMPRPHRWDSVTRR